MANTPSRNMRSRKHPTQSIKNIQLRTLPSNLLQHILTALRPKNKIAPSSITRFRQNRATSTPLRETRMVRIRTYNNRISKNFRRPRTRKLTSFPYRRSRFKIPLKIVPYRSQKSSCFYRIRNRWIPSRR